MNICVYGGGNIAHALAATLTLWHPVTIITHHPKGWSQTIAADKAGNTFRGKHPIVATDDVAAAKTADIVFLALPQFAYDNAIMALSNTLRENATVAFVPAPAKANEYAKTLVCAGINAVGFQRAPHIARIIERGRSVTISTDRATHRIAVSNPSMRAVWARDCSDWFGGTAEFLSSFQVFTFNNSNPILHPARMAVLFDNWRNRTYATNPFFYAEWTDESSELYLSADAEIAKLVSMCPNAEERDYIPLKQHYGVSTAKELTVKLRSIPAFKSILSPMVPQNGFWIPDFSSRYFTEDVDCGLVALLSSAKRLSADCPTLQHLATAIQKIRT